MFEIIGISNMHKSAGKKRHFSVSIRPTSTSMQQDNSTGNNIIRETRKSICYEK